MIRSAVQQARQTWRGTLEHGVLNRSATSAALSHQFRAFSITTSEGTKEGEQTKNREGQIHQHEPVPLPALAEWIPQDDDELSDSQERTGSRAGDSSVPRRRLWCCQRPAQGTLDRNSPLCGTHALPAATCRLRQYCCSLSPKSQCGRRHRLK